jgi:glycosyltransferase involved in cell wall biosynthesis
LEAFRSAHDRFHGDSHLIICGEGPEQTNLESFIKTSSLAGKVHLIHSEDKFGVISAMDVFVMSSLAEGFSNAVLEAMSMARPVIATSVGGNPEAVQNGLNGIIVPPADAEAMAEAMVQLGNNMAKRHSMGAAGKERAGSEFSLERMVEAHQDLYESLARGR